MKKFFPCLFFLLGNEILSCIVLMAYAVMAFVAIVNEAERNKNGD